MTTDLMYPSKCLAERDRFLRGDIEATKFVFSGGGHDKLDNSSDGENGSIVAREWIVFQKEDVSTSAAASFGLFFEPIIGVSSKNHVTHTIGDDVIGVDVYVVKELVGCGVVELCGSSLMATEETEANKELFTDCTSIVEEGANNSLDTFDACIMEEGARVRGGGELILGPVLDLTMLVGQELIIGGILVEIFDDDSFDVTIHREADLEFLHVEDVHTVKVNAHELVAW